MLALNTQSRQQADDALVIGVDVIVLCRSTNERTVFAITEGKLCS